MTHRPITKDEALSILWSRVMEESLAKCSVCQSPDVAWMEYPGTENSPTFGGPWEWTPAFFCADHEPPLVVGRVGGRWRKRRV